MAIDSAQGRAITTMLMGDDVTTEYVVDLTGPPFNMDLSTGYPIGITVTSGGCTAALEGCTMTLTFASPPPASGIIFAATLLFPTVQPIQPI